jgi:hypothetical protein
MIEMDQIPMIGLIETWPWTELRALSLLERYKFVAVMRFGNILASYDSRYGTTRSRERCGDDYKRSNHRRCAGDCGQNFATALTRMIGRKWKRSGGSRSASELVFVCPFSPSGKV